MALIKCKECAKEISDTVKQCPHCGSSKHRNFFKQHPIITIILVIAFVPQFISYAVSDLSKKEEQTPPTSKHAAKKTLTPEEKQAVEYKIKAEKVNQELNKKENDIGSNTSQALRVLKTAMKDPNTFQVVEVLINEDKASCITYKAENSFKGKSIASAVVINMPNNQFGIAMEDDDKKEFNKQWNKFCANKKLKDDTWLYKKFYN